MQRIGIGRDIHRLVRGRALILGGVQIPFHKGEAGHSDGDALTHAIIDALLGASGTGDIGELFPDTDGAYKNADSIALLKEAWRRIKETGAYEITNIDCIVSLEKPAILPYKQQIRQTIAAALDVPVECIYVKGKTGERLGDTGKGRAVETFAAVLLRRQYTAGSGILG
ncbi:MAG: 2-C-methyl-D-erythritol 2,4-cyclodiphosphate synthase [Spirochaetaceae bacterium]|jgi:2-C-methyl-D-erythritol 2,4-cyclodiphosphate synthase|nr:2-C-methyl-D-erythritol 2,4-cyclodiphosphate synthase [Spirochaetaceae bacterium]